MTPCCSSKIYLMRTCNQLHIWSDFSQSASLRRRSSVSFRYQLRSVKKPGLRMPPVIDRRESLSREARERRLAENDLRPTAKWVR